MTLVPLVLAVALGCQAQPPPPPPPPDTAAWTAALAGMEERPARVVVIADSMGELSNGWRAVWEEFHRDATTEPVGTWRPPRWASWTSWSPAAGVPSEAGLSLRGQELRAGDPATGSTERVAIPTTLDLYYTARPGGAALEIRIGDQVAGTIDTSRDELGRPVEEGVVESQRWRSPPVGAWRTWSVTALGEGGAIVEAASFPPSRGIEVHGTGRSGHSTRQLLDSGYAIGHIEAMTARGEPPDLVVWAADTADSPDKVHQATALLEAFAATRAAAPGVTIAHYIPTGHGNRADWPEWADLYRSLDESNGVLIIDAYEGLGDVSNDADPLGYSEDGVHLNATGQAAVDQVFLQALRPSG